MALARIQSFSTIDPHELIEVTAVLEERASQAAFLYRAQLPQHAIATGVLDRGASLETVDGCALECKVERHACTREEKPGAPVRGTERKTPLGDRELWTDRSDLDDADGMVASLG